MSNEIPGGDSGANKVRVAELYVEAEAALQLFFEETETTEAGFQIKPDDSLGTGGYYYRSPGGRVGIEFGVDAGAFMRAIVDHKEEHEGDK